MNFNAFTSIPRTGKDMKLNSLPQLQLLYAPVKIHFCSESVVCHRLIVVDIYEELYRYKELFIAISEYAAKRLADTQSSFRDAHL